MSQGLDIGRVVRITINMSPKAAPLSNTGVGLVVGDSDVIDIAERLRNYTGIDAIGVDFGMNSPEYKAAALYYAQEPKPLNLMIGRWARTAVAGLLLGSPLTVAEQDIAKWAAITAGSFKLTVDGKAAKDVTVDFTGCANLNAVAAKIDTAITADGHCTWNGSQFKLIPKTTGKTSKVDYLSKAATGTDISPLLKMTAATAAKKVDGLDGETALDALKILADYSTDWSCPMFAASTMPDVATNLEIATFIQAMSTPRVFGVTEIDPRTLDPKYDQDNPSKLKAAKFTRAVSQYSSTAPYAIAALLGGACAVDYSQPNASITHKFKQEPGVQAELLTETQAQALEGKNCNVFVRYNNDTSIIEEGVCASGVYLDEVMGLDWLRRAIQGSLWNALYTCPNKIPQDDEGQQTLIGVINNVCSLGMTNKLLGVGIWNADGFGALRRGDQISGFYAYAPPVATQLQADREARKSVPLTVAAKLRGATHSVDVLITVNR